jgi:hypothetical protein
MTAFNIVRFCIKPGRENDFLAAHKAANRGFPGMRRFSMVKTGEGAYCVVGEWASFEKIVAARPGMIAILDTFRDCLIDLGGGLGMTDPIAGIAVMEIYGSAKAKGKTKRVKAASKKKAVTKAVKKTVKKPAKKR